MPGEIAKAAALMMATIRRLGCLKQRIIASSED
jgi:hypothetical protein